MKDYIINRYNHLLGDKFALQDEIPISHVHAHAVKTRLENIQVGLMALDSLRNEICGLNEIVELNHHYELHPLRNTEPS
jgi:hypothetical protein